MLKAKVCLIGEAAVGKTSLIRRYVEDSFDDRYISTLGSKVSLKKVWLTSRSDPKKSIEVQLSIWDLIGERSYLDTLHRQYLQGAQGIIAVCDVTRYSTFEALVLWVSAAFKIAGEVPLAIVVNKVDLKGEIMCLYDEHEPQERAERYHGFAIWSSAKTGENVNPIFGKMALAIIQRIAPPDLV